MADANAPIGKAQIVKLTDFNAVSANQPSASCDLSDMGLVRFLMSMLQAAKLIHFNSMSY